ncbi:MAG: hypothetical protein IPL35_05980 [Sphingobacteriales bacterium]|nr:hypothetical protein [Sphingobacteriales bacterium]
MNKYPNKGLFRLLFVLLLLFGSHAWAQDNAQSAATDTSRQKKTKSSCLRRIA